MKVDDFYIEKEQDVYERFLLLQDQLYQLRDQKTQLIKEKNIHDNKTIQLNLILIMLSTKSMILLSIQNQSSVI